MSIIYGQPVTFGGKKAEGEIPIKANGTYDVAEYATANVDVHEAPVLLWTNASPTSGFAAQDINLVDGYSAYLIETATTITPHSNERIGFVNVGSTLKVEHSSYEREFTAYNGYINCSVNSTGVQRNVPLRIWGVKFTL